MAFSSELKRFIPTIQLVIMMVSRYEYLLVGDRPVKANGLVRTRTAKNKNKVKEVCIQTSASISSLNISVARQLKETAERYEYQQAGPWITSTDCKSMGADGNRSEKNEVCLI